MNKTILPKRRLTEEEIRILEAFDNKKYQKLDRKMKRIGKKLRSLLPLVQEIKCFNSDQVRKASVFIDSYDDFCSSLEEDFKNRRNPEDWA